MMLDWSKLSIYVRPGPTDMRKQINALAVLVEESMGGEPMSGNLYLFCNRRRTHLKILYWDANGFALWLKRLEVDRFPWPKGEEQAREISLEQLRMVLAGIDFWSAHQKLEYSGVK
jgi:transposase